MPRVYSGRGSDGWPLNPYIQTRDAVPCSRSTLAAPWRKIHMRPIDVRPTRYLPLARFSADCSNRLIVSTKSASFLIPLSVPFLRMHTIVDFRRHVYVFGLDKSMNTSSFCSNYLTLCIGPLILNNVLHVVPK